MVMTTMKMTGMMMWMIPGHDPSHHYRCHGNDDDWDDGYDYDKASSLSS